MRNASILPRSKSVNEKYVTEVCDRQTDRQIYRKKCKMREKYSTIFVGPYNRFVIILIFV